MQRSEDSHFSHSRWMELSATAVRTSSSSHCAKIKQSVFCLAERNLKILIQVVGQYAREGENLSVEDVLVVFSHRGLLNVGIHDGYSTMGLSDMIARYIKQALVLPIQVEYSQNGSIYDDSGRACSSHSMTMYKQMSQTNIVSSSNLYYGLPSERGYVSTLELVVVASTTYQGRYWHLGRSKTTLFKLEILR